MLAVTRTLNGNASLTGHDGALAGLDIEQLLQRLERRPLSGGGDFRNGRTKYNSIAVALKIEQGKVTVEDVKVLGPAVQLALTGSASIPQRELDLTGTASLVTPAREGVPPFALPFIVQGSWDDPIMLPDAEALIRRSGAAAPLLDAVRDRRARDAARSVIERLTGRSAGAAAGQRASAGPGVEISRYYRPGAESPRRGKPGATGRGCCTQPSGRWPRSSSPRCWWERSWPISALPPTN